jgi:hypothetical protein
MNYRLVSMCLPKNGETGVVRMQNRLFREFGFASSLCLPVSVPLAFMDPTLDRAKAIRSISVPRTGFPIGCVELSIESGCFFLIVEPRGKISELASGLVKTQGALNAESPGRMLIPAAGGIFLGCNESGVSLESAILALSPLPVLKFSSFSLTIMDIEVRAKGAAWWTSVSWEIIYEKRLPKAHI